MSSQGLRLWAQARCSRRPIAILLSAESRCTSGIVRKYATNPNMDFGNKSQLLSEADKRRTTTEAKHDHVGPFQLGLSGSALRNGKKVPKWSELSTTGKVVRTTARTTNLGVILLGAGLSALLLYSLTSELFSKNSPTVIYGDACERIKQSQKLQRYLNGPFTFHNNRPSAVRPRHRNRHVISRVMVDAYGNEHMIMTFYVQGRPEGEAAPPTDESYFEHLKSWAQNKFVVLSDLSFDGAVDNSKRSFQHMWDNTVRAFKYLSGSPLPPKSLPPMPSPELNETSPQGSGSWSFAGIFSSLKGSKTQGDNSATRTPRGQYTEGEVHADLVKDQDGYFVFRYLLVDIPSKSNVFK
ncbi:TIM21-domain-containing protein [Panaeolus papilionaceus]|nr:TIM21-domain-containing protein [Panaeolus papilionaceus]